MSPRARLTLAIATALRIPMTLPVVAWLVWRRLARRPGAAGSVPRA